jgi:diguanylate cyclase (GGDEF)-like protein
MERSGISRLHLQAIVDGASQGVLLVDREFRIAYCNRFMELHGGRPAAEIEGRSIFECFPELPQAWLTKKLQSVLLLDNFSFTNWLDRPYLFRLDHDRPITGGVDCMRQDCVFFPVHDAAGVPEYVCITISDATDSALYHGQLQQALLEVEDLSRHDSLTGAGNRRHLDSVLQAEFSRSKRYGGAFSVLMFDLDNFKVINDRYGHLAGDEVLRKVACVVSSNIRTIDFCARYGGDEFVIIEPATCENNAAIHAERLRTAIAASPVVFGNDTIQITVSIGVAEYTSGLTSPADLLGLCDKALYVAKAAGRNCVTTYSSVVSQSPRQDS